MTTSSWQLQDTLPDVLLRSGCDALGLGKLRSHSEIASGGIATSIALRISPACITGDTSEKSFRFMGYSCG